MVDALELGNLDLRIRALINILNGDFDVIPKFGVEIEFYLRDKNGEFGNSEKIMGFREKLKKNGCLFA